MTTSQNRIRLGTFYCVLCATAYTAYNACLRDVSEQCDSAWINCVAAFVSMTAFGLCLFWQAVRGGRVLPPWRELLALLVVGLITQMGAVLFVWSMSIVGVAVTATLQTGGTLATVAILGWIALRERVSWLQLAAILLIVVSVIFFSRGAESASQTTARQLSPVAVLLGVGAAVLSGLAFGTLSVCVRKTVTSNTSSEAIVFLINMMGVVVLGPLCVYRLGVETLVQTAPRDLAVMVAAGVMNLVAFFFVTKSLKLIPVVRFGVLNNGLTAAFTAAVGIVLLAEPWNLTLLFGVFLSIVGIVVISLGKSTEATVPLSVEIDTIAVDRQTI